jgi:DNA-binding LacI/PurR family transcriptional regulator
MRSSKAMNIGIVLFWNISDSIFNQILIGISKITRQYEYNIILIIPDKKENEFDYINIYKKRQIDGVIIVSPFGKEGGFDETEHVRLIKDENIPAVIINGFYRRVQA